MTDLQEQDTSIQRISLDKVNTALSRSNNGRDKKPPATQLVRSVPPWCKGSGLTAYQATKYEVVIGGDGRPDLSSRIESQGDGRCGQQDNQADDAHAGRRW